MNTYLPIWWRPPNKFIKYKEVDFIYGNYSGKKIIAVYSNKDNKIIEETARVIWNEPWL
jgi:hypothetical protein